MTTSLNTYSTRIGRRFVQRYSTLLISVCMSLASAGLAQEPPPANNTPNSESAAAASTKPTPIKRSPANPTLSQTRLLKQELVGQGLVELNAAGKTFLSLWQTETSGEPFGAVLILHGAGQTLNSPDAISQLRSELSDHGWTTLSVALPDPAQTQPSARILPIVTANDNKVTPDDSSTVPAVAPEDEAYEPPTEPPPGTTQELAKDETQQTQQRESDDAIALELEVQARIKAAMEYLNSRGQYNIVLLGQGLGAARAAAYLEAVTPPELTLPPGSQKNKRNHSNVQRPIRALVLVNPRNMLPSGEQEPMLVERILDRQLPILDIFYNLDYRDNIEAAARQRAAKQQQLSGYRQLQLIWPTLERENQHSQLAKRVRGYLYKNARGVEIGKR